MTHYTSCNSAMGVLRVCVGERIWRDAGFRWWNCACLKSSNQSGCCWMNIVELTFHPCWTYVVLVVEAHWVVEHNHCTYNRCLSTWFYHDVGNWRACTLLGLALRSKHIQYAHHPGRWNSFGLIFWEEIYRYTVVWRLPHLAPKVEDALLWIVFTYNLSNPRKEVAATWSRRSVSCVSCVRDERGRTSCTLCIYSHTSK